jgi:integrase/recombinase XerD
MVPRYTARFILRTDRCRTSDVKPLHLKCYLNKKKVVLSTGHMVHRLNWNQETQKAVYNKKAPLSRKAVDSLNIELSGLTNKVNHIFFEHRVNNRILDVDLFKELYARGSEVFSFHDYYQQYMELHAGILATGTVRAYKTNQKLLREFMPQMHLHHLTPETVKRYDAYLRTRYNNNSRMKHHRMAKRVMLQACKKYGLANPYEDFRVRHIDGKREYLNKYEVAKLQELLSSKRLKSGTLSALKKYLFSCHVGGLRISDIHSVGIDDVYDGVLVLVPQKTSNQSKRVQIPMPAGWQQYVQHLDGARFFDHETDQHINRALKELATTAGITKKLTFHTARHTFATGYLNAGGKVEVLQRILGHADIKTTMVYVHISRERLKDENDKLNLYK